MLKYLLADTSPLAQTDSNRLSLALLLLRVFTGAAFIGHGIGKIQAPFAWLPPDSGVPGIFQALGALAEFGGGMALILGLLTPLVSLGLIATMIVAALFHIQSGDAFFGGYELAVCYLVISVFFLLVGPGKFSLDKMLRGKLNLQ